MIQTNGAGELTHLLTLEGMPKEQIIHILDPLSNLSASRIQAAR